MAITTTSGLLGATAVADRFGRKRPLVFRPLGGAVLLALLGTCSLYVARYQD